MGLADQFVHCLIDRYCMHVGLQLAAGHNFVVENVIPMMSFKHSSDSLAC